MKLINKAALVAEIEKLKGQLLRGACSSQISMETSCKEESYNEVLSFLDTLEVKEVKKPIEIRFECIPVMASTEIGKSEYQIRANVTEDTLQQILKTKIIKML